MPKNHIFYIQFKTYFRFKYKKTEISLAFTSNLIIAEISLKIYLFLFFLFSFTSAIDNELT